MRVHNVYFVPDKIIPELKKRYDIKQGVYWVHELGPKVDILDFRFWILDCTIQITPSSSDEVDVKFIAVKVFRDVQRNLLRPAEVKPGDYYCDIFFHFPQLSIFNFEF
jgi:hypothetical protein